MSILYSDIFCKHAFKTDVNTLFTREMRKALEMVRNIANKNWRVFGVYE